MSEITETIKTECCGAVIDSDSARIDCSPDGDTFVLCGEGVGCEPSHRAAEYAEHDRRAREEEARNLAAWIRDDEIAAGIL